VSKPVTNSWDEFNTLVMQLADGGITAAELARLEAMLLDHPEMQRRYCELRALNVELLWKFGRSPLVLPKGGHAAIGTAASSGERAKPASRLRTRARGIIALAACLAVAVLIAVLLNGRENPPRTEVKPFGLSAFAQISEAVGEVEILSEEGESKSVGAAGSQIRLGQTIRTGGEESSTAVVYTDGTRLDLAKGTTARLWETRGGESGRNRVFLTAGIIRAETSGSAVRAMMILSTPHAEIRLHGAKLASSVDSNSTYIELEEGTAELVRNVDGQSLQLAQGSFVVCTNAIEPMSAERLLAAPAEPRSIGTIHGPALAYSPNDAFLALAREQRIELCHPASGERFDTLMGHEKSVRKLALTPSGDRLVSGGFDPFLIVWNVAARREERRLPVGPSGTRCLALNATVAACVPAHVRQRGELTLWDLGTGEPIHILNYARGEFESLAFSPDGRLLAAATGDRDHSIFLYDSATGHLARTLPVGKARAQALAFTADGRYLIGTCDDGAVRFWDTHTGELAKTHASGKGGCVSLAVAPTGNRIAWGANDSTVEVWKIDADLVLNPVAVCRKFRKRGPEAIAFSADARRLATTRDWELLKIWDVP